MGRSFAFIYIFLNLKTVAMVDCLLKKKSNLVRIIQRDEQH